MGLPGLDLWDKILGRKVTCIVQEPSFPAASAAVYVTVWAPISKIPVIGPSHLPSLSHLKSLGGGGEVEQASCSRSWAGTLPQLRLGSCFR